MRRESMSLNYFEKNLLVDLENKISSSELHILGSSEPYFLKLEQHYRVKHNRIDWDRLQVVEKNYEGNSNKQLKGFIEFFTLITEKYYLSEDLIWIGDSAINFAITGSVEVIMSCLNYILDIPQHHYFLSTDYKWCFCFTFEGEMFFGTQPD